VLTDYRKQVFDPYQRQQSFVILRNGSGQKERDAMAFIEIFWMAYVPIAILLLFLLGDATVRALSTVRDYWQHPIWAHPGLGPVPATTPIRTGRRHKLARASFVRPATALALAFPSFALANGGSYQHKAPIEDSSKLSPPPASSASELSPFVTCGGKRVRDAKYNTCRGPADF
jgi:hypothetical protein